jgi:hypothetical protein
MPPPAAIAELPEARRPFSPAWQVHDLGRMDVVCSGCGAFHWMDEKLSSSHQNNIKFGMCCFSGKMDLPKLHEPPPELRQLLTGTDDAAKNFRKDICRYNNALAMTSLGCKMDNSVNQGAGPYVFKIHGKLTHKSGSLLPAPNGHPTYAQLYIYDPADALNYRMGHQANSSLHRETMQQLQDMLWHKHPGVQLYQQAHALTHNMDPDQDCNIALRFDKSCDRRCYNLPTAASHEVAVILPGSEDQPQGDRDIILRRKDGALMQIDQRHPSYVSLHYVLLFPTGQLGWHPRIEFKAGELVPDAEELEPNTGENNEGQVQPSKKRKYISQTEYFRYRLHPCFEKSNHIFIAGKLFQEYIVDAWALCEQARLLYIQTHQKELRTETYQGVVDALASDANATGNEIGQRTILPSSFIGGTCNMIQNCQDALAINHHFHGADPFITITANPNWPEVTWELLPGQSASDRPDLVVHVFHAKVTQLLNDLEKHGVMGRAVARVWTIEFQKCGLPHMHLILFLAPEHKLRTPEDIDSLISAEFPDEHEKPELYELVKKFMVHNPCGTQNPQSPCMDKNKCSKSFPKPF